MAAAISSTSELLLEISSFRLKLTGEAATKIAIPGSFAIAKYCFYKIFQDPKANGLIARLFERGSIEVTVVAENKEAKQRFHSLLPNDFLKLLNQALLEYSTKTGEIVGKFDNVELMTYEEKTISKNEFLSMMNDAVTCKEEPEMILTKMTKARMFSAEEIHCLTGEAGYLGEGSFGQVRLGFVEKIGDVALKCFEAYEGERYKDALGKQIMNESKILQHSDSNRIVHTYGWTKWMNAMALIMEYMPGGNLAYIIFCDAIELHPSLIMRFCYEIADGMVYLHQTFGGKRSWIHGNLRPSKVLLDKDLHCKIGNFGVVTSMKRSGYTVSSSVISEEDSQTASLYLAPERLMKKPIRPTKQQDTYSFGLIIHGLLSREAPDQFFPSRTEYLNAVSAGKRPDTAAIQLLKDKPGSSLCEALESIMTQCWAQDPTIRPAMSKVREQLLQIVFKMKQSEIEISAAKVAEQLPMVVSTLKDNTSSALLSSYNPKMKRFSAGNSPPCISYAYMRGTRRTWSEHDCQRLSLSRETFSKLRQNGENEISDVEISIFVQQKHCQVFETILCDVQGFYLQRNNPTWERRPAPDQAVKVIMKNSQVIPWGRGHEWLLHVDFRSRASEFGWEKEAGINIFSPEGITLRKIDR